MGKAEEFRRLLFAGHGRAVVHLQENGAAGLEEVIFEACVRNTAHDRQCETSHAAYLRDILALAHLEDALLPRIYEAARTTDPVDDHGYDHAHQMGIIAEFAKEGNPEARVLFGELFDRNCAIGSQTGSEEIVRLFGVEGYHHFLQNLVKYGLPQDDFWRPGYIYEVTCQVCGKDVADSALEEYSCLLTGNCQFDPAAKKYRPQTPESTIGYADYKERLYSGSPKPAPIFWGQNASDGDLRVAAEDLLKVEEDWVLILYLRIFHRISYPRPEALVPILRKENEKVAHSAFHALALCNHPSVREAALEWISDAKRCYGGVRLLATTFQSGDEAHVEHAMRIASDDDILYWCISSALKVAEKNEGRWENVLNFIYERTRSSYLRWVAIKMMIVRGSLTHEQRREIQWDADDSIRELCSESSDTTESK